MKRGNGRVNKEIRIERLEDRMNDPDHVPAQIWRDGQWVRL